MSEHEGIWTEYRPTYWDGWSACKRMGDIVRCRDCESATDHCEGMDVYWCEYLSRYVGADTFCAWASRKESE